MKTKKLFFVFFLLLFVFAPVVLSQDEVGAFEDFDYIPVTVGDANRIFFDNYQLVTLRGVIRQEGAGYTLYEEDSAIDLKIEEPIVFDDGTVDVYGKLIRRSDSSRYVNVDVVLDLDGEVLYDEFLNSDEMVKSNY